MSTHWIELGGRTVKVVLAPNGQSVEGLPSVDGVAVDVELRELESGVLSVLLREAGGVAGSAGTVRSFCVVADPRPEGDGLLVGGRRVGYSVSDPRSLRTAAAGAGESGPKPLKAPMPGRIVRVLVSEGDAVEAGQGCVVMEAMKMQNELKAPKAGRVAKLAAVEGETVASNAVLLVVE